jgi:hypothetical protein
VARREAVEISMSRTPIMILAAAVMTATAIAPASASPGAVCVRYANKAVSQQKLNERKGCGFAGPRWHTWWDAHYAWCLDKSPARLAEENGRRSHKLAQCLG